MAAWNRYARECVERMPKSATIQRYASPCVAVCVLMHLQAVAVKLEAGGDFPGQRQNLQYVCKRCFILHLNLCEHLRRLGLDFPASLKLKI